MTLNLDLSAPAPSSAEITGARHRTFLSSVTDGDWTQGFLCAGQTLPTDLHPQSHWGFVEQGKVLGTLAFRKLILQVWASYIRNIHACTWTFMPIFRNVRMRGYAEGQAQILGWISEPFSVWIVFLYLTRETYSHDLKFKQNKANALRSKATLPWSDPTVHLSGSKHSGQLESFFPVFSLLRQANNLTVFGLVWFLRRDPTLWPKLFSNPQSSYLNIYSPQFLGWWPFTTVSTYVFVTHVLLNLAFLL